MAQLKSTNVLGNLSATGNIVASKIVKIGGNGENLLLDNGDTYVLSNITDGIGAVGTQLENIQNDVDKLATDIADAAPLKELEKYATIAYVNETKTAILGQNDDEDKTDYLGTVKDAYIAASAAQVTANDALPKAGGNVTGHIYLTGADTSNSTKNTSQLIFGTSTDEHIAISSNNNALVINPGSNSTAGQVVLHLNTGGSTDSISSIPSGIKTSRLETDKITSNGQITSTVKTGTAPFAVASTTLVSNLNADLLDGYDSTHFATAGDLTGLSNSKLSLSGGEMTGPISFTSKTDADTALALLGTDEAINNIVIANSGTNSLILKRITPDNFIAKLGIAKVYNYKGTLANLDALKTIESAAVGDVYNLIDSSKNYACIKTIDTTILEADFNTYWQEIGTAINLEGYATVASVSALKTELIGANEEEDTTIKYAIKLAGEAKGTAENAGNAAAAIIKDAKEITTFLQVENSLASINQSLGNKVDTGTLAAYAKSDDVADVIGSAQSTLENQISGKVSIDGSSVMTGNLQINHTKACAFVSSKDVISAKMEYDDTLKAIKFKFA